MTNKTIKFSALFGSDEIICNPSDDRMDHIIQKLIAKIGNFEPSIDIENVFQLLLNREGCGIMLVKPEVAVVHARVDGLKKLRIAIATHRKGFICTQEKHKFNCLEGGLGPVNFILVMMAPSDDPASYLRAVAALTLICKRDNFIKQLLNLKRSEDVWKAFEQMDEQLPEYVEAHHIMRTDFSQLNVNDNISKAIDLFCTKTIGEFPVVDSDGDLVGVVSEEELIRLCLPEYITWMEELSPIINFEPFAEILRREKDMPVIEIMELADRYATIDESTPAIQVARVMMRRDVRQVFVVRENKLMGVISIKDLIQKVLRS